MMKHVSLPVVTLIATTSTLASSSSATTSRRSLQKPSTKSWELPEWAQWMNTTTNGVDWSSPTAFRDWLDSIIPDGSDLENADICPLLETAVGMGRAFGIAADCSCDGDVMTQLDIACNFQQCLPLGEMIGDAIASATERRSQNDGICGNVALNFTFGGTDGGPSTVTTSVCTDFPEQLFQDACFSYSMSLMDNSVEQSCSASYGGQDCTCEIDHVLCLNVNCSAILPGAAMDTCQVLKKEYDTDLLSWIPNWNVFSNNFTLDADMIPWLDLDWEHLDWLNFNVTAIEWSSPDWLTTSWTNLVGNVSQGVSDGVCTFLETAVQLSEALGADGSCKCGTTVSDGLVIDCDFSEICVDNSVGSVVAEPLCASVNMTLNFDKLAGVDNEVCMDFAGDTHRQTCFAYTIPFADQDMTPTCSATYGDGKCSCSIDEHLCILVDCSDFEESAVMNTCQIVELGGAVEAQRFVLPFQVPAAEEEMIDVVEPSGGSDGSVSTSELANVQGGSSGVSGFTKGGGVLAIASFLVLALA